ATGAGLFFVDEAEGKFMPFSRYFPSGAPLPPYCFNTVYIKSTNTIYTTTWQDGVYVIEPDAAKAVYYKPIPDCTGCLSSSVVQGVLKNRDGTIWAATQTGLLHVDEKNNKTARWLHDAADPSSLISSQLSCLYEDRDNNIWIGTFDGLSKLSKRSQVIQYFKKEFSIDGKKAEVYDVIMGPDGRLYAATYGNGVFSIDLSSGNIKSIGKKNIHAAWSVNTTGKNVVVTGHQDFIYSYNTVNGKISPVHELKPFYKNCNLVLFAYTASNNDVWYSLNMGQGLVRYNAAAKKYEHYHNRQMPRPFSHYYFNTVTEDEMGNLWFGVNKNSNIVKWDKQLEKFEEIITWQTDGISRRNLTGITSLLADGKGFLWAGTDGSGLIQYDIRAKKARLFTIEDGMLNNNIALLVADKNQRLWIGTRKGLNCLLPGKRTFISFTTTDGLPENYFSDGAAYYDTAKNQVYLGSQFSIIKFDPDELLKTINNKIPVCLEGIKINDSLVNISAPGRLLLPYYRNNLQFNFTTINYDNSSSVMLNYKLEGADHDWKNAGGQRSVQYLNVPEGEYVFKLRAKNNISDSWSEIESPLFFEIKPPYWRTWWFRLLVILTGAGMVLFVARTYYNRKLERQKLAFEKQQAVEQERTRIATDMHDDLGAGLTRIKFITENIAGKLNEGYKDDVNKLTSSANELVEKMGEIIWAMNEKNNTLEDMVFYLRSYAAEYCQENNISCFFSVPDNIPEKNITGNLRRNIFLLLKECLHNIVKHAGADSVTIAAEPGVDFKITIHDNGRGIDLSKNTATGNGLINMEKRVAMMNGRLEISNHSGTRVEIKIPLQP
ncbi:MAG: two-component regulator propeller domain-containing protein, partial [Chitinophagaceae bacterium]|nr:two-component regulator propeller domain-containing protein [Chitinophagaceae bacterium]